jgi:hypothetical protein
MTQKYFGYTITVKKCDDATYSLTIHHPSNLRHDVKISGFETDDNAFDDAYCRIDAMLDSL